jgi:mono/diheme cytochrome c family protein
MKTCHAIALAAMLAVGAASAAEPTASFKEDVQPILLGRCVSCHSPNGEGYQASGLDLTNYKGIMTGTKFGPMIVPGDPDSSNLMRLLDWRTSPQLRMPHNRKQLSVCDRNDIRAWIRQGAKDN